MVKQRDSVRKCELSCAIPELAEGVFKSLFDVLGSTEVLALEIIGRVQVSLVISIDNGVILQHEMSIYHVSKLPRKSRLDLMA